MDFLKPQLSKTEKAVEVLERQLIGLQWQIAGICIQKGIKPKDFAKFNLDKEKIQNFLKEANEAEQEILNELSTKNKALEAFKVKEDGK